MVDVESVENDALRLVIYPDNCHILVLPDEFISEEDVLRLRQSVLNEEE